MTKNPTSAWIAKVIEQLNHSGPQGQAAVDYILHRRIWFQFSRQKSSAARWMPLGHILFNLEQYSSQTPPDDPFLLRTLVHEVHHLRQGWLKAFSVYGELDAWQVGFRFYYDLTGKPVNARLVELLALPLAYDRRMLKRARTLMQVYDGKGYRIDLYPLFPLNREIGWHLGLHGA